MIIFVIDMRNLFLASISGLLLAFSWPAIGIFPLLFVGFVPLFILEDKISCSNEKRKGLQVFAFSFLSFFLFNLFTTYWIYHATVFGAIAAFLVNALLMATAFWLYYFIKNTIGRGIWVLLVTWVSMEYFHLNWDLSWPWLTLGNGFANTPSIVQWYEFTGVLGGSLWILLTNFFIFKFLQTKHKGIAFLKITMLLIVPILLSYYLSLKVDMKESTRLEVLIVQPNIDPYTDKFNVGFKEQLDDFIALAKTKLTEEIQLLVGPETALLEGVWENRIEATYSIRKFRELQKEFPNLNILVGASTYKMFVHGEEKTATAREIRNENTFYDAYNSAIFIPVSGEVKVYHKTKLVPGVEKMPYPNVLDKFAALAVNLGGISGSLGNKNEINTFNVDGVKVLPLICYESIYGDLITARETDVLCIITNDGWWKNSAGYKQHSSYARLRAIEQRKAIIRSANTGISSIITLSGAIEKQSKWGSKQIIKATIPIIKTKTFYSIYGDFIGRISAFIFSLFFLIALVKKRIK